MPTDTKPRDHLVRALYADLIGPYQLDEDGIAEQELLELPPSRYYLTGFLSPEVERAPEEVAEDDPLAIGDDENEEETHGSAQEEPKGRNLWLGGVDQCVLGGAFTVCRRVSAITLDPEDTRALSARDWMGVGP